MPLTRDNCCEKKHRQKPAQTSILIGWKSSRTERRSTHQELTKRCEFGRIDCIHSIVYLITNNGRFERIQYIIWQYKCPILLYIQIRREKKREHFPCRWRIATSSSFSRKRSHLLLLTSFFLSLIFRAPVSVLNRVACTRTQCTTSVVFSIHFQIFSLNSSCAMALISSRNIAWIRSSWNRRGAEKLLTFLSLIFYCVHLIRMETEEGETDRNEKIQKEMKVHFSTAICDCVNFMRHMAATIKTCFAWIHNSNCRRLLAHSQIGSEREREERARQRTKW